MSTPSDQLKSSLFSLKPDQLEVINHVINGDVSFVVATTGFGKTVVMLHAIKKYLEQGTITQAIVTAPASVISHWPAETKKWGLDLDVQALTGSAKDRLYTLANKSQVIVVSLNNLEWLLEQKPISEMIVIDELTTACGKQTRKLANKKWKEQIKIRVGMSASPVAESFEKLYSMMRVLDCGERLGRTKEGFLNKHFFALDFKGYRWQLKGGAEEEILDKINDVLYVVESDKHETLPPVVEGYQYFDMSPEAADAYAVMKRDMLLELSGSAAVAPNKAVASGKMRQIASGFIVDEYEEVHDFDELRAHAVWVWAAALQGRQGVILYQYNHQRVQLRRVLADQAVYAYGGSDKAVALAKFKAKDFQLLVAQERVLSHGIDGLQDVCSDMLFMQPPWSADTKIQAIGRLHRTGQKHTTNITTLMANKSLDSLVEDRQTSKAEHMKNFLTHLRQQ